jgi:hypothetical protein
VSVAALPRESGACRLRQARDGLKLGPRLSARDQEHLRRIEFAPLAQLKCL